VLLRVELKPAPLERLPLKAYTRKWPSLRRGVPGPPKDIVARQSAQTDYSFE
jgi:hypothetical protein